MTKNSIAWNRSLFIEDNLPVMRGLDSESIDLIATDPPFNKGVGAFEGTTKAGVNVEFKDVWNWNSDVHDEWLDQLREEHPRLFNMIQYANASAGDDMGAFICWMAVRVLEMHRVLKPTGSIYLHCDPTASHYLKSMMDAVFGRKNFRNEIVWQRAVTKKSSLTRDLGRDHDIILRYAKTGSFVWNKDEMVYPYDMDNLNEKTKKAYSRFDDRGRRFQTTSIVAPGSSNGPSGEAINYKGQVIEPPVDKHWVIPGGRKPGETMQDGIDRLVREGRLYQSRVGGLPRFIRYLDEQRGVPMNDLWTDIPNLTGSNSERTGYPTQKPLALYKRMIQASSNPGDMVLDPFAGCATTCVAAEQLGRQWIGIDIQEKAGPVILERLQTEVDANMAWGKEVQVLTVPPTRTDDGKTAAAEFVPVSPKAKVRKKPVAQVRAELIVRDGPRCQGCGWEPHHEDYLQVDHKKPRSLKGKDEMDNYALLCDPCNRRKSNKLTLHELQNARVEEERMDTEWYEEEGKWK